MVDAAKMEQQKAQAWVQPVNIKRPDGTDAIAIVSDSKQALDLSQVKHDRKILICKSEMAPEMMKEAVLIYARTLENPELMANLHTGARYMRDEMEKLYGAFWTIHLYKGDAGGHVYSYTKGHCINMIETGGHGVLMAKQADSPQPNTKQ